MFQLGRMGFLRLGAWRSSGAANGLCWLRERLTTAQKRLPKL
jgi:hypothetical protein